MRAVTDVLSKSEFCALLDKADAWPSAMSIRAQGMEAEWRASSEPIRHSHVLWMMRTGSNDQANGSEMCPDILTRGPALLNELFVSGAREGAWAFGDDPAQVQMRIKDWITLLEGVARVHAKPGASRLLTALKEMTTDLLMPGQLVRVRDYQGYSQGVVALSNPTYLFVRLVGGQAGDAEHRVMGGRQVSSNGSSDVTAQVTLGRKGETYWRVLRENAHNNPQASDYVEVQDTATWLGNLSEYMIEPIVAKLREAKAFAPTADEMYAESNTEPSASDVAEALHVARE